MVNRLDYASAILDGKRAMRRTEVLLKVDHKQCGLARHLVRW